VQQQHQRGPGCETARPKSGILPFIKGGWVNSQPWVWLAGFAMIVAGCSRSRSGTFWPADPVSTEQAGCDAPVNHEKAFLRFCRSKTSATIQKTLILPTE